MEVVDAVKSAEASRFKNTLVEDMPCSARSNVNLRNQMGCRLGH